MNEISGSVSLLVSRLSDEQRSKLEHVSCQHVFLADDVVSLLRFLAMCKDNSSTVTQYNVLDVPLAQSTFYSFNVSSR